MSNPGGSSGRGRWSIWDLDDPKSFEEQISSSEASGSDAGAPTKKKKGAHNSDSNYPLVEYTHFAYDACLKWYEEKTMQFLESTYLRNVSTRAPKIKDALEEHIMKALQDSPEFGCCEYEYNSTFYNWIHNCISTCTFNVQHVLSMRRPTPPGFNEAEDVKEFKKKMEWWQKVVKRMSRGTTRGMGW
jgi:hypothetical protein